MAPFFTRREHYRKVVEFAPKPAELGAGEVDQRAWRRYQAYLAASRPIARADFYKRLLERKGIRSIRELARVTGEDWSRVARVLKLLELPAPVLEYLRTHDSPELVRTFSERRLHELLALKDPQAIWRRFQELLGD